MTKIEAAKKIAELEARIEALEAVMLEARGAWNLTHDPSAVCSAILKGGR